MRRFINIVRSHKTVAYNNTPLSNIEPIESMINVEWNRSNITRLYVPTEESLAVLTDTTKKTVATYTGPAYKYLLSQWYCQSKLVIATSNEYIKIQKKDGATEYIAGPYTKIIDSIDIQSIGKYPKIFVSDDNILYVLDNDNIKTICGPNLYTPHSSSEIYQMSNKYICSEGECIFVTNTDGTKQFFKGPYAMYNNPFTMKEIRVIPNIRHTISNTQYIKLLDFDGTCSIIKGPCTWYHNPTIHKEFSILNAHVLGENQSVEIFSPSTSSYSIVTGPTIFIPDNYDDVVFNLDTHVLSDAEYSVVFFHNGKGKIVPGPTNIIHDNRNIATVKTFKKLFIKENTAIYVEQINDDGKMEQNIVHGPILFYPKYFTHKITNLSTFYANEKEYLTVEYADSTREIIKGPVHKICDNINIVKITKSDAIFLCDNEIIVSYLGNKRNIIKGPTLYFPSSADEIINTFSWHGKVDGTTKKAPNMLNFTKLKTGNHQLYYNIESVRTMDDANITVKIMIFYEYVSIEKMLENTNDPIANFINAVTSDVVSFASNRTFETFKRDVEKLSIVETYSNLLETSNNIGVNIKQVAYRGLDAHQDLEKLCHKALCERTEILILEEQTLKNEELENIKLNNKLEREQKNRLGDILSVENKIKSEKLLFEHKLETQIKELALEKDKKLALNSLDNELYLILTKYGVNIEEYLLAQYKYQKADKLFSFNGTGNATANANTQIAAPIMIANLDKM